MRDDSTVNNAPVPHSKRLGRELAMEFLFSCELKQELPGAAAFELFMESVQEEFQLMDNRITRRAREYAVKLYEAVTLEKDKIDGIIAKYCRNWDMDRLSPVDRNILRVAVAEMTGFPDVPPVVSIDEAVEIARDFSGADAGNFINGVLNAIKNSEIAEVGK
ncbi:MAG: transcription antitermination factor NusB [Lentisphaerae bacterium]|nr:transcription antitermination factor NusB [Lentisphaerota bacterium]MBQ9804611.1 transcription antitermination factor NusB [Lentisphaeria bacterium]